MTKVRFVNSDDAGSVGAVLVDGIRLERGGEPKDLTEDQLKRARDAAPKGALRAESTGGAASKATGGAASKEDE